jgi:hypothetical protein
MGLENWNPRYDIRDPEKTYSVSRIRVQGSKSHWIPDSQHCSLGNL